MVNHPFHARTRLMTGPRKALTLIELLLGIAATALIGLAISSMLFATAYGTDSDKDLRGLIIKQKLAANRLTAAIRSSKMILAKGTDYIVLWMSDSTGEGEPNLSEMRRIQRDSGTGLLPKT